MVSKAVKFMKKAIVAAVVAVIFGAGFIYLQNTKKEVAPKAPEEQIWTVSAVPVQISDARPSEEAFGTVTAGRDAQLRFGVSGEVIFVSERLRNGSDVKKGEVLARLDSERSALALEEVRLQIKAETNQIDQLSGQLVLRERMYDRAAALFGKSVGSQAEVDAAELAVSVAENQLVQSRARLAQYRIAARRHQKDIDDSVLTAPFDGTLSDVNLALGNQVTSAHLVAGLTDLSQLEVSFVVPVTIYQNIDALLDQSVDVKWTSGGAAAMSTQAVIRRAEVIVDKSEGGGRLYAELPAHSARTIPPGAFVSVSYTGRTFTDVVMLPEAALADPQTVYAVAEGRARARRVELVHRGPGQIWVRGDLKAGEMVIATRLPGIGDGLRVRVAGSAQ